MKICITSRKADTQLIPHCDSRLRTIVAALILGVLLLVSSGVYGQNSGLPIPWQQRTYHEMFSSDLSDPKIENGYLVAFRRVLTSAGENDAILLQSLSTSENHKISFWLAGASVVWTADVSLEADNRTVLVVGSVLDQSGSAPRNFASVVSLTGELLETIDLGDYEPELSCVAKNGTLWTFGQVWSHETSGSPYDLVRQYSSSGELLRSFLSKENLLQVHLNLSARLHYAGGAPGSAFLTCSDGTVGVYVGPALRWVEIDSEAGTQKLWKVRLPPIQARITGFSFSGGQAFGSFYTVAKDNSNPQRGLYRLDLSEPSIARWQPIGGTVASISEKQSFWKLVGNDSSSLIYLRNEVYSANRIPILFWSKIPR